MRATRRSALASVIVAMASLTPIFSTAAHAAAVPAGQLAYITKDGNLDLAAVMSDGTLSAGPEQIAPVTTAAAPETVQVEDLMVSGDQSWLAWVEVTMKPDKMFGKIEVSSLDVLRNNQDGTTTVLHTPNWPIGFAGDSLVVAGNHAQRVVLTPTPHFVNVPDKTAVPLGTYPNGVVDEIAAPKSTLDSENLRLTTFSGHHTLLHHYTVGRDYRDLSFVQSSPDGQHLVVERGNHQDFAGIGPSSLFDEYSLSGGYARTQLGHYGTNKADWRLQTVAFVGSSDEVWLGIHDYGKTVEGAVVRYTGGKWQLIAANAITVAGSPLGYAAVQPGKWVPEKNSPAGVEDPVPTANAELWFNGQQVGPIDVQGSTLVWLNGFFSG